MVIPLSAVRGQERALSLLRPALGTGTVPPAILFTGEEGTGKELAARAFAHALLCREPSADGACGRCRDCLLLSRGEHPNLALLEKEEKKSQISVEQVRDLLEELSLVAFADRPRVVLVLPVDDLNASSGNALLKTLEEPPPRTCFLLVSHRLSRVLPTIASRCRKVPFGLLSTKTVAGILLSLPAGKKGERPTEARVAEAAACSGGSPGRGVAFLESGSGERRRFLSLLEKYDPSEIVAWSEGWKKGAEGSPALLLSPLSILRDLALLSSGGTGPIMNEDVRNELEGLARKRGAATWLRALRSLLDLTRVPAGAQKRLAVEALLFRAHGNG
jgi:DNA polymerase-3 subunit delta'